MLCFKNLFKTDDIMMAGYYLALTISPGRALNRNNKLLVDSDKDIKYSPFPPNDLYLEWIAEPRRNRNNYLLGF